MSTRIINLLNYAILVGLIIFTIALVINSYNSGVYADVHGLDGAKVGWFEPFGVPFLALIALITIVFGIYTFTHSSKKTH